MFAAVQYISLQYFIFCILLVLLSNSIYQLCIFLFFSLLLLSDYDIFLSFCISLHYFFLEEYICLSLCICYARSPFCDEVPCCISVVAQPLLLFIVRDSHSFDRHCFSHSSLSYSLCYILSYSVSLTHYTYTYKWIHAWVAVC